MMEVTCISMILLMSLIPKASSQNIQIQVLPQPVIYQENDLVIQCSITNPSQLMSVYYIQLHRNSSTDFETVLSIFKDQNPQIQWPSGSTLQNRASADGSEIKTPSTATLKLTIDKDSVLCPNDFTAYRCKMSGFSSAEYDAVTQETNPVTIIYTVKPRVIEMPRVRILGELTDTPVRRFPIATVLQLTCEGQIGNDARKTIRWCSRKSTDFTFTGLRQTPIHSEASLIGCQYTRSSTITYNLTSTDTFTQYLCESGDTGMCGTGSAIQYVNISTESNLSKTPEVSDTSGSHETGVIAGSVIGSLALLTTAIVLVYFARRHNKCTCEKRSGENRRDNLQNTSDLVEDESGYTTISDESDRHQDTYDEITGSEEKNQYEAIAEKEKQEDCAHPYESLKKHDTAQHGIEKGDASNSDTSCISKKAEQSTFHKGFEEYENASFK
uniref:Uncharacterized protein LOC111125641 isoform X1 n=1 Tax=Crassostrea virginica TaxID=6565 RepID=A0A8B8DCF8_CRAVI|nr:uncharacterized protein LOC111125641 isoform X1 [Crassostrea virginica]